MQSGFKLTDLVLLRDDLFVQNFVPCRQRFHALFIRAEARRDDVHFAAKNLELRVDVLDGLPKGLFAVQPNFQAKIICQIVVTSFDQIA